MDASIGTFLKTLLEVILVVSAATLLCLFVPALNLLELFLVLAGSMILAAGASTLNNLIHYHKVQQMLREIELERQRSQQLPPLGHSQASTLHHSQRRSRRLQGP